MSSYFLSEVHRGLSQGQRSESSHCGAAGPPSTWEQATRPSFSRAQAPSVHVPPRAPPGLTVSLMSGE